MKAKHSISSLKRVLKKKKKETSEQRQKQHRFGRTGDRLHGFTSFFQDQHSCLLIWVQVTAKISRLQAIKVGAEQIRWILKIFWLCVLWIASTKQTQDLQIQRSERLHLFWLLEMIKKIIVWMWNFQLVAQRKSCVHRSSDNWSFWSVCVQRSELQLQHS